MAETTAHSSAIGGNDLDHDSEVLEAETFTRMLLRAKFWRDYKETQVDGLLEALGAPVAVLILDCENLADHIAAWSNSDANGEERKDFIPSKS